MKTLFRTLLAIGRYYQLKRRDPQCPHKLAEWIEGHREKSECSIRLCQKEAGFKFSHQCACGRFKTSI